MTLLSPKEETLMESIVARIDAGRHLAIDPRTIPRPPNPRFKQVWHGTMLEELRRQWVARASAEEIAAALGSTPAAVRTKAQRIGLTKRERKHAA
jgi:hypothetical protein